MQLLAPSRLSVSALDIEGKVRYTCTPVSLMHFRNALTYDSSSNVRLTRYDAYFGHAFKIDRLELEPKEYCMLYLCHRMDFQNAVTSPG